MNKIKLLLIDDDKSLVRTMSEYFSSNHAGVEVLDIAYDGKEGIRLVKQKQDEYDLIILDLVMPKLDGSGVLEKMKEEKINKKVIVLTSYNSPEMIQKISEYGVSYYLLKPFDLNELEKRILEVINKEKEYNKAINLYNYNLQVFLTNILHELGVSSHIKGYQYIKESIMIVCDNPNIIGYITKELYPQVAIKYNTTVSRVERAIRHAIEISWNRGSWDLMEELFGYSIDIDKAKPTNSEFIITLADKLNLEFKKVI